MSEVNQETVEQVQLSLADIISAVQVIDTCSARGAFKGEELQGVGSLRNRLAEFAKANIPEQPEESTEEVTEEA